MTNTLATISWDNSNIYKNFADPKILTDLQSVEKNITQIESKSPAFEKLIPVLKMKTFQELSETIPLARDLYKLRRDTNILILTLHAYASTAASVDSLDYDAKNLSSKAMQQYSNLSILKFSARTKLQGFYRSK